MCKIFCCAKASELNALKKIFGSAIGGVDPAEQRAERQRQQDQPVTATWREAADAKLFGSGKLRRDRCARGLSADDGGNGHQ